MNSTKKIAIIGLGFMGGSLAKALRRAFPGVKIWGYARSEKSYQRLKKAAVVHRLERELRWAVEDADIVILGLPVEAIITHLKKIAPFLKKNALVFDLGSSKEAIVSAAKKFLPPGVNFVGCHPLCGSEKCGAEFSQAILYEGALCILTTSSRKRAAQRVKKLWQHIGARVVFMTPARHDRMLSAISHLPHVISFSLTKLVPQSYFSFVPASFKDLTRISKSPANIWSDIFLSNKNNITADIGALIKILKQYERALKESNKVKIESLIKSANSKQKIIP